jgi:hypothetical protein
VEALDLGGILCIRLHSMVFEDNTGAHQLAAAQHLSTCTRHFSAESHFFWQAVCDCALQLARVSTHDVLADAMSKGLVHAIFKKLCKKLMGWWAIARPFHMFAHLHALTERIAHMKRFECTSLEWSIKSELFGL